MKNIEIKGLLFVQTHESDPARYDVRDADFKRVAYIEWDGLNLVCSAADQDCSVLQSVSVTDGLIGFALRRAADAINEHIAKNDKPKQTKTIKAKIWKITGYKGFDDWDGPQDNNMSFTVIMDARFSKEDVEEILANRFSKKHRSVVINATEIECRDVERGDC